VTYFVNNYCCSFCKTSLPHSTICSQSSVQSKGFRLFGNCTSWRCSASAGCVMWNCCTLFCYL
jgi:hypothetical protein